MRKLTAFGVRKIFECGRRYSTNISVTAQKTPLYDFHLNNYGKIVTFAGHLLPVQYGSTGVGQSHLHTRKHASIFDVSHMLQTYIRGQDAVQCMEELCTADLKGLGFGAATLSLFTNKKGGILDDLIVTKITSDWLYVVSNASRKENDKRLIENMVKHFQQQGKDVSVEFLECSDRALIAVQGPEAVQIVQGLCRQQDTNLKNLFFMNSTVATLIGIPGCRITRCGYTGEDGVEISVQGDRARDLVEALLQSKNEKAELAGLGARDSLRLEAGLCLYGNDIDETITPIEAGLAWTIGKRRRNEANFPGATTILNQLKNGTTKRRIGIRMEKGPPARQGIEIYAPKSNDGTAIGYITSGCPSPSLGGNIAIGYVNNEQYRRIDAAIQLKVRDRFYDAKIAKMPFIPTRYYIPNK